MANLFTHPQEKYTLFWDTAMCPRYCGPRRVLLETTGLTVSAVWDSAAPTSAVGAAQSRPLLLQKHGP